MTLRRELPCTKVADMLRDAGALGPYLSEVQRDPRVLHGQHPIRAWEYAMALWTLKQWQVSPARQHAATLQILDVGSAGSGFWRCLADRTTIAVTLSDPHLRLDDEQYAAHILHQGTVEEAAARLDWHARFDVITGISVIEHVQEVGPFLGALHTLLAPGGLLFLTTDYWDAEGPDTADMHWMRHRIYNKPMAQQLLAALKASGFDRFGGTDWTYRGPQVSDYSVLSLALTKTGGAA
jgi:2-polyprenyl-3-methyl-5-hydroxy-6-metoxy-1,4-benzoquinol methylase